MEAIEIKIDKQFITLRDFLMSGGRVSKTDSIWMNPAMELGKYYGYSGSGAVHILKKKYMEDMYTADAFMEFNAETLYVKKYPIN